jgi:hypothetical protein
MWQFIAIPSHGAMSYFANSSNIEVEVLDGTARLEK